MIVLGIRGAIAASCILACFGLAQARSPSLDHGTVTELILPAESELPGWFFIFRADRLHSLDAPLSDARCVPRGRLVLSAGELVLWSVRADQAKRFESSVLERSCVRGIVVNGGQIQKEDFTRIIQLPKLEYLCLNGCALDRIAASANCDGALSLTRLDMARTSGVTDELLRSALRAPELAALDIQETELSAACLTLLYSNRQLRTLSIGLAAASGCEIDLVSLVKGKALLHLRVANGVNISTVTQSSLATLESLSLESCPGLDSTQAARIAAAPALASLDISGVGRLDRSFWMAAAANRTLAQLAVRKCREVDEASLTTCLARETLVSLTLDGVDLSKLSSDQVEQLGAIRLRRLSVANCAVNHVTWDLVSRCKSLTMLDMSGLTLFDSSIDALVQLDKLEEVVLVNAVVSMKQLLLLASVKSLRVIRMGLFRQLSMEERKRITDANPNVTLE